MLDVLTYCADVQAWSPGVRYSAELAANVGAALTGIHVSPRWPAREPRGAPPSIMAELVAHAQEEVRAAMEAGVRFGTWARSVGVASTRWHVALGDPVEVLGVAGNWNDLIVIDRKVGDRDDTTDLICELLLSGFVCIGVPDSGYALTRFDRIVVAFDGYPGSVRALHAATPLLLHAAQVILLECEVDVDADEARPAFDPRSYLADHGIHAELETVDCSEGALGILDATSRNRADMLVVGARGRQRLGDSRLREATQQLLKYAGVPILMAH